MDQTVGTDYYRVLMGIKNKPSTEVFFCWKYGCELEELIGKAYNDEDYLLSETKRMIEDALLINPYIKSVEDVEINKDLDKLNITCNVLQNMEMFMLKLSY